MNTNKTQQVTKQTKQTNIVSEMIINKLLLYCNFSLQWSDGRRFQEEHLLRFVLFDIF